MEAEISANRQFSKKTPPKRSLQKSFFNIQELPEIHVQFAQAGKTVVSIYPPIPFFKTEFVVNFKFMKILPFQIEMKILILENWVVVHRLVCRTGSPDTGQHFVA